MGRTKKFKEVVNAFLTYEGVAEGNALANENKWQIKRISTISNQEIEELADDGEFDKIWNQRTTYFSALPFVNTHSIQFDGVNDRIDVAHTAALDFGRLSSFTISFWVKSPNTSAKNYIEKMNSNVGYRIWDSGANKIQVEFRGTGGTGDRIRVETSSATAVNNGNWHHIAVTYSGSGIATGMKIYIDGAQVGTSTLNDTLSTNTTNSGTLSFASRSGGGTNFVGNMDEVSIWDAELSAFQVDELYNDGFVTDLTTHSSGSLVSWWSFNDVSYPTVPDSESSYNGTMINMTPGDVETEVPHG